MAYGCNKKCSRCDCLLYDDENIRFKDTNCRGLSKTYKNDNDCPFYKPKNVKDNKK